MKLRQLQATRQPTSVSFPRRRPISKLAAITVTGFCLLTAALFTYFSLTAPKNKQQANSTLVNIPGGQFLPSLEQPLNLLVMGVDSNGKDTERFVGTRSDSMILVSLDPQKQKVGVISIPRDSRVQIANGRGIEKINSAHALGGPQLAVATVSQYFNVPIDKYLVVDATGIKQIFESLGSVDVIVEKKMSYVDNTAKLFVDLEPGLQTLNAKQIEQYIRFRHDAKGDIGRIERQQWFARQLLTKLAQPEMLVKLPGILDTVRESVITNLSVDEMVRLFGFACHLNSKQINMATLPGTPGSVNGISYWLLDAPACNAICNKLINYHPGANPAPAEQNNLAMGQDSAIAYTPPKTIGDLGTNNSPATTAMDANRPWSVIIRYPKAPEQQTLIDEQVTALEQVLSHAGFILKGKYKANLADCQHEQIIEGSQHSLSFDLEGLRTTLPVISKWPAVINIDPLNGADFVFVVTPNSKFSS